MQDNYQINELPKIDKLENKDKANNNLRLLISLLRSIPLLTTKSIIVENINKERKRQSQ